MPFGDGRPEVHQHDVGRQLLDRGERLAPGAGLADDLDVALELEDLAHAAPEQRVAVDDDDARLAGSAIAALATLVLLDLDLLRSRCRPWELPPP